MNAPTVTTTPEKTEKVTLSYSQGSSDKVYQAEIKEAGNDTFTVNFAYGRKGATLRTGTKTQTPVPYENAKKIYDKVVKAKVSKGYIAESGSSNAEYLHDSNQHNTGIHCQLLNPIDEREVASLIHNIQWCMQEKMDGRRMLIHKSDKETIAINRKGLSVGAPAQIVQSAELVTASFIIDGEAIDNILHAFDLLMYNGMDIKHLPYLERYDMLSAMSFQDHIKIVPVATTPSDKQALMDKLKDENREGIVLKKRQSVYHAGRPNSGGDQVKFKFYDTASVVVTKINDKRSVGVSILDQGKKVFIGNVTIPPNKKMPATGDIIEVRYLYAYKNGSLYQPTFLQVRHAIDESACVIEQLKYKSEQ